MKFYIQKIYYRIQQNIYFYLCILYMRGVRGTKITDKFLGYNCKSKNIRKILNVHGKIKGMLNYAMVVW